jgi:hypothetical protein
MSKLPSPPALNLESTEAIKWAAVLFMTADHINKYLLTGSVQILYCAGRLAMPMFLCVLAYNLSRVDAEAHKRTMARMLVFGIISTPIYILLGGVNWGWWPLNVMFLLFLVTFSIYAIETGSWKWKLAAVANLIVGGGLFEYFWPAALLGVVLWSYFKKPTWLALITAFMLWAGGLGAIYGNLWALAALPLIIGFANFPVQLPRHKWAFYAYYPLHLSIILFIKVF